MTSIHKHGWPTCSLASQICRRAGLLNCCHGIGTIRTCRWSLDLAVMLYAIRGPRRMLSLVLATGNDFPLHESLEPHVIGLIPITSLWTEVCWCCMRSACPADAMDCRDPNRIQHETPFWQHHRHSTLL